MRYAEGLGGVRSAAVIFLPLSQPAAALQPLDGPFEPSNDLVPIVGLAGHSQRFADEHGHDLVLIVENDDGLPA